MAELDFVTRFPHLFAVESAVSHLNVTNHAVHTVTVILDNGDWRVDIGSSDKHLDDVHHTMRLNTHGQVLDPLKRIE